MTLAKRGKDALAYLSFTEKGHRLARKLAEVLGGEAARCGAPVPVHEAGADDGSSEKSVSLAEWTAANFPIADGLIFVGAAGIAVRAIAPHVTSKTSDPPVVVVDEGGNFAVSLLSGHLGGGNDLAKRVAAVCGAQPVITTATDINDVFAVDEWARRQNCHVANPHKIKDVSSALLGGDTIGVRCFAGIDGKPPAGVRQTADGEPYQVLVDIHDRKSGNSRSGVDSAESADAADSADSAEPAGLSDFCEPLRLIPRIAVLGIGCRRGVSRQQIEERFQQLLKDTGLAERAFCAAASIDLKKDEAGLAEFCRDHGLPLMTFPAEALQQAPGAFSPSEFVKNTTGVDNVCERSAVLAAKGSLYEKKRAGGGVTMAVALKPYRPDWRWKYE